MNSVEASYRKQSASVEAAGLNAANAESATSAAPLAVTPRGEGGPAATWTHLVREQRQYRDELALLEGADQVRPPAAATRVANERGVQSGFAAFSGTPVRSPRQSSSGRKSWSTVPQRSPSPAKASAAGRGPVGCPPAEVCRHAWSNLGGAAQRRRRDGAACPQHGVQASLAQQRANKATLTGGRASARRSR